MNKETYERLKPYYIHLRRGYKGNYIYGLLQKDFDVLYEIYKELGGRENLRYTCSSCCLRLTKFLGKLYYEYEENLMKEPVISDETKEKKKRGREKKEEN
jgi:hypothetical protein